MIAVGILPQNKNQNSRPLLPLAPNKKLLLDSKSKQDVQNFLHHIKYVHTTRSWLTTFPLVRYHRSISDTVTHEQATKYTRRSNAAKDGKGGEGGGRYHRYRQQALPLVLVLIWPSNTTLTTPTQNNADPRRHRIPNRAK